MGAERFEEALADWIGETDRRLWRAYDAAIGEDETASGLTFPGTGPFGSNGPDRPRVSEQEARFAFSSVLEDAARSDPRVRYAVEVPTRVRYCFSRAAAPDVVPGVLASVGRSAQTDLAIYWGTRPPEATANVEFKAGGYSLGRSSERPVLHADIAKDVSKLLAEEVPYGVWYHLLQRVDRRTLEGFSGVIEHALRKLTADGGLACYLGSGSARVHGPRPKQLVLHVCVLDPRRRLSADRTVQVGPVPLEEPLAIRFSSAPGRFEIVDHAGWSIDSRTLS